MEIIIYLLVGMIIGGLIMWFSSKANSNAGIQQAKDEGMRKFSELEKEFVAYRASTTTALDTARDSRKLQEAQVAELTRANAEAAQLKQVLQQDLATSRANLNASLETIEERKKEIDQLKTELSNARILSAEMTKQLATAVADNNALQQSLETQKQEIEALGKKFNMEFENIANKILETKTEKFTELNKNNLKHILEPFGQNINEFKKQVDEVYKVESKERFSLGEKVKELAALNNLICEEARNLTRALKTEAKTQGGWGEMILENILERSGLVKGREYFMEHQLLDENGNAMRSDSENKKMRPDAVIKYPDNRNVIIDSKVSLNAFTRCVESNDDAERKQHLSEHVASVKRHILALSAKGYDDYNKSLDFVMMFVPSEPAYIAALQADPELWNFAYDKRILLLSPTNLIVSLKLIVDLWKREYQNQNALKIAESGAKLYDKFVGFVSNLESVGDAIGRAQHSYSEAYKQLSTGNDNLVRQATRLKDLGLKTKKELPVGIISDADNGE